jgi:hypothetical protein
METRPTPVNHPPQAGAVVQPNPLPVPGAAAGQNAVYLPIVHLCHRAHWQSSCLQSRMEGLQVQRRFLPLCATNRDKGSSELFESLQL